MRGDPDGWAAPVSPDRVGRGDIEDGLGAGDGRDGAVGWQQLGVVKGPDREALGALEPHERHRDGRERAEEGEVVRAAGAPLTGGLEARACEELTRVRHDAGSFSSAGSPGTSVTLP